MLHSFRRLLPAAVFAALTVGPAYGQQDQSILYPLPVIEGALPWHALGMAEVVVEGTRVLTRVPEAVRTLHGSVVKAVGFLIPLNSSGTRHFLVEKSPHCPFCVPVGREQLVEVNAVDPIDFMLRAVVIEGEFEVLDETGDGSLYRMSEVELLDE